jgi:hypothetical protein
LRLREREEALILGGDSPPAALGTDGRRRPGLGAGAVAGRARRLEVDRDLRRHALERVFEGHVHHHLDVAAALPARPPPTPGGPARAAEEAAEEVAQVAQVAEITDVSRPGEVAAARAGAGEDA